MAAKNFDKKELKENEDNAVHLFAGETILARAKVMRYNPMSTPDFGVAGKMFVTNFKVAFDCSNVDSQTDVKNRNSVVSLDKILVEERCVLNDIIPLTAIYQIHAISTSKQKRKKVKSAKKELSSHYDIIEVETKDFRIIHYNFKNALDNNRRSCFQMISHYAFPTSVSRLFAFDYGKHILKSKSEHSGRAFCAFSHSKDYEMNLYRLQSSEQWRVSSANFQFEICQSLPEYNVCPSTLEEEDLKDIACSYVENRFPIWLWNDPDTGAALLLSSRLRDVSNHPLKLMDSIRSCHRIQEESNEVQSFDLCSECVSLKELKHDFNNLRKASVVHSSKEFWSTDSTWLSDIDDCRWLQHVLKSLVLAEKIAGIIKGSVTSVIVSDDIGRDFSMLITSLVQILLDPYYRTHVGLQALIQKDWVMGGHPFSWRLGNISRFAQKSEEKSDIYDGKSPVFLLFLDCLHQLMNHHPTKFEYTEQFLILIADCSYSSLFQTFIFNCNMDCKNLSGDTDLISAWDFISSNIPTSKFITTLKNPAYKLDINEKSDEGGTSTSEMYSGRTVGTDFITPFCSIVNMQIWRNYFCRWFPSANKQKGFSMSCILQLQQKQLLEEVMYLEDRIGQLQCRTSSKSVLAVNLSGGIGLDNETCLNHKKHKREFSRHFSKEEDQEKFLTLMSDFYFLKLL